MVSLPAVLRSNSLIPSTLPPKLVALFVGATSGIGEASLLAFAKTAVKPRAYFIGRSQTAADRILAECRSLNPAGEFIFIQKDVSLIRNVDEVCKEIKAKEKFINIMVLSAGVPVMDRRLTSENLHLLTATTYYSRLRFIANLLPLLRYSPSPLSHVVFVAGGGREGPLDSTDFPALRVPLLQIRGHLTSLITLGLEAVAKLAPEVTFVHDYPGTVKTPLMDHMDGLHGFVIRTYVALLGRWVCVPVEESGERHLYLATSARYPPAKGGEAGIGVEEGVTGVAVGSTGEVGSGVYSVGWDCESSGPQVIELLAGLREKGMVEEVWKHTEGEFERITGVSKGI
ncbi:uncharacterized protein BDZ99DRAFT_508375 [Mytilinidion resinicola]|uniref:NAD(P)-binding protein n=1 Tax=Mytilinidion resinicola TaxID=574789 RepID=A0A6A6YR32_9PEZI|nr:uncharacterized protein BDZ99DRAFT_508375 [Mytilinidion resinicola]KAF2811008.1 hypothetical protein BDZ99DRAFT_508375 [Mytilinidion resinicola]